MPCRGKDVSKERVVMVSPLGNSGTEGGGEAGYRSIWMVDVFSPSLKRHFCKLCCSYCTFCSLGIDSLQSTFKVPTKIKQKASTYRNCSEGFVAEVSCVEMTDFNLWNSSNNLRSM